MATGNLIDLNTGAPASLSDNLNALGYTIKTTGTKGPTTETAIATSTGKQTNVSSGYSNVLGTTPQGIAALNQLFAQLQGGPNISAEEALAKFPNPTAVFHREGAWTYLDPITGREMDNAEAVQFTNQQIAKRQQYQAAGGYHEGGTPAQQATSKARLEEIGRTRQLQQQFSPNAASVTGNALISKAIADALTQLMPGITLASEGAGTSKGSMRALLTQKAGEKGAVEGAALAANLTTGYGTLQMQAEQILEELTKQDPNSPTALLANLIIGTKGIVSNTSTGGSSTTFTSNQGTTTTQKSGQDISEVATKSPTLPAVKPSYAPPPVDFSSGGDSTMVIAEGTSDTNLLGNYTLDQFFNSLNF